MKLTAILLVAACLQVSARSLGQQVTLSEKQGRLENVFAKIERQTGYTFTYAESLLSRANPVTIEVRNAGLETALDQCLKDQPFTWTIIEKTIVIKPRPAAPVANTQTTSAETSPPIRMYGRVTDAEGKPLQGATITNKRTGATAVSDASGTFFIVAERNEVITISFIGFESKQYKITAAMDSPENKPFTISLIRAVSDLDKAVVVAYNTTTRRTNTAAITSVNNEDVRTLPVRSFEKALQGQVPGLYVSLGTGQPGGGNSSIVLRGIASAIGGSARQPMIVIDGLPVNENGTQSSSLANTTGVTNPMSQINMNDIESYTVLKDAAAIALYGSKASNGVILILTKKGRSGKTTFNFHHQTDLARAINNNIKVLNQQQYLGLLTESYKNTNPSITDDAIMADLHNKFPVYTDAAGHASFYPAPDWRGAIFKTNAITTDNQFSASGGTGDNVFYFSADYLKQNGVANNSGLERSALRYNFSNNSVKWLTVGLNSTFSFTKQSYPTTSDAATANYGFPFVVSPLNPIYLQNGGFNLSPFGVASGIVPNPVAVQQYNVNRNLNYRGLGSAFAEIRFTPSLRFKTNLGGDFMLTNEKIKQDMRLPGTYNGVGSVQETDATRTRWITTNTLTFDKLFAGRHLLNVVAGQEAQSIFTKNLGAGRTGFSDPDFQEISAGSKVNSASGTSSLETQYSFFSQTRYTYDNRLFLSASARRDGSSKFGSNNRFGTYWSVGAGWELSKGSFIKDNFQWISFLKLRGSVGTAGNSDALSAVSRFTTFLLGNTYDGDPAAIISSIGGNSNIKWEELHTQDAGLEFSLFGSRVDGTIDWYHRKTTNLIYLVHPPTTTGLYSYFDNIGSMDNHGLEVSLNIGIIHTRDFSWKLLANWSTNKNKLVKADVPESINGNLINKVGQPFSSFYLPRWAGVNPADGSPQWYDNKGAVTGTYNTENAVIAGKPAPDGYGGITNTFKYRNLQLSAFFYYQYGFQVYDAVLATLLSDGNAPYNNQSVRALNRWQKPGDIAANPVRKLNNTSFSNQPSTRYLFDGDFIRLKNVILSYDLPVSLANRLKLNSIRIYGQANNLALWTRFKGLDPELVQAIGTATFAYPLARSYSIGLDVNF